MRAWFEAQLAAGLPAFAGTSLSGTVAVKDELINQLLKEWMAGRTGAANAPAVDAKSLLRHVTNAAVRAEQGRILVDFGFTVPPVE